MNKRCEYCCNKIKNKPLGECHDRFDGLDATVRNGKIVVSGYYDGTVGLENLEIEANFCPMCGHML